MADPFLAEIRMFGFNFAPRGWAFCDGQLMPLSQNTALFALLGTTYGGDGKSNFALPDLQGRAALHPGQGPGLSPRQEGEAGGATSVSLLESEMPLHTHVVRASSEVGDSSVPGPAMALAVSSGASVYRSDSANPTTLAPATLPHAGGGLPHNNMQPYLALNFCIALQGIFPARP
jgi:microcystin-dependent protein